jgi:hypothetical protein
MPPRADNLVLEDVRIVFRNFSGEQGMYNAKGDRNFAVILDRDVAQELANDGWNIKQLKPREDEEEPTPYLAVKVKMDGKRPPNIIMIGGDSGKRTILDESTVDVLDHVDIGTIDMVLRPYDWDVNGATGRSAYLQDLYVTIIENPLDLKYGNTSQIATVEGPMMERTVPLEPEF